MVKVLFILRSHTAPAKNYTASPESGVSLSTYLIANALREERVRVSIAGVSTPEEIAHVVAVHRPTFVIIETLWVNPKYFPGLQKAFPHVTWIIREHSDSSFRVYEENAFGWIVEYLRLGVEVMCNSLRSVADIIGIADAAGVTSDLVSYGPNIYPTPSLKEFDPKNRDSDTVNIGCFGAVRPMKNHITQAIAAVIFARNANVKLNFHINGYNIEGYVDPVLKNLRDMFSEFPNCNLVEHGWMSHADFLSVLDQIDICSQVSFSETFNIVAADAMSRGVPLITSSEIPWIGPYAHRDKTSAEDIAEGFLEIWEEPCHDHQARLRRQREDMRFYSAEALKVWLARVAPNRLEN